MGATCYITSILLYIKANAQCNKLAMVIGQTTLTMLAAVDSTCHGKIFSSKSTVWDKVPEKSTLSFGNTLIPF